MGIQTSLEKENGERKRTNSLWQKENKNKKATVEDPPIRKPNPQKWKNVIFVKLLVVPKAVGKNILNSLL